MFFDYHWIVYVIGFLAQGFFSARILVQWYKSEKAKSLKSPASYWIFSLIGAYLMFVYGWCRDDFSIIFGQMISYYIYVWNINAKNLWKKIPRIIRYIILLTPVAAFITVFKTQDFYGNFLNNDNIPIGLVIFGSVGQLIFTLRFVYQWFYSYRLKQSALPTSFWAISLVGSGLIIIYGIIRKDPVLILGQAIGFIAYIRNIWIGLNENKRNSETQKVK